MAENKFKEEVSKLGNVYQGLIRDEDLKTAMTSSLTDFFPSMKDMGDSIKEWIKQCSYQGFSVEATLNSLAVKWAARKAPSFSVSFMGIEFVNGKEFENNQISSFTTCMIILFLQRGSNFKKIKDKTDQKYNSALKYIQNTFGIKDPVTGSKSSNMDAEQITLPRVAACYPVDCLTYIKEFEEFNLLVDGNLGNKTIPRVMRHPLFAAIAPIDYDNDILPMLRYISYTVDRKINKKPTPLATLSTYIKATRSNERLTSSLRSAAVRYWNLSDGKKNDWSDAVLKLIEEAKTFTAGVETDSDKW